MSAYPALIFYYFILHLSRICSQWNRAKFDLSNLTFFGLRIHIFLINIYSFFIIILFCSNNGAIVFLSKIPV